ASTLIPPASAKACDVLVVRHHGPAFSGGDLLVRIEGKGATHSEAANLSSLICGADGLAGIFDDRQAVLLGDRADSAHIARPSENVHRQNRASIFIDDSGNL